MKKKFIYGENFGLFSRLAEKDNFDGITSNKMK
jgi:hypothetical protein